MDRRGFLGSLAGAPLAILAGTALLEARWLQKVPGGQGQGQSGMPGLPGPPIPGPMMGPTRQPGQWPNAVPPGDMPGPKLDPKLVLKADQKQIVKDVNHLFDLATKLHKQVAKTDSSEVLSMNMIHTAEQIEKLAKHIKNLATRG